MNKYTISIIALSFCSISTPLLSAEKNSKFIPKLQIQQNTATTINRALLKKNKLGKSIAPTSKLPNKAKLPAIQQQIKKLPAIQRQTRILPKANKSSLADRINKTRLQNRAKLLAPKTSTRVRTLGGVIKKNQLSTSSTRSRLSNSRLSKLPAGTQGNLNLSGTGSNLDRIRETNENLQELQNLRQFEEMQGLANLPGSQSVEQQYGSEHIDPNSPASPENQIGQGRDCALVGGALGIGGCFNNAAGSSGADGARIGSGQPGGATDGVHNPDQGQASQRRRSGSIGQWSSWRRSSTTGRPTRSRVSTTLDGEIIHTVQTRERGGRLREVTTVRDGTTHRLLGESVTVTNRRTGKTIVKSVRVVRSDGGSIEYITDEDGNESEETYEPTPEPEPESGPAGQPNPADDHSGSGNDCGLRPGDCKQQPAVKDMIGQPADGGNDVTGTGSATAGAVTRNAVINPGDGSYQASGSGGGGRAPSVIGTMPDPNPVPGTPAGTSR